MASLILMSFGFDCFVSHDVANIYSFIWPTPQSLKFCYTIEKDELGPCSLMVAINPGVVIIILVLIHRHPTFLLIMTSLAVVALDLASSLCLCDWYWFQFFVRGCGPRVMWGHMGRAWQSAWPLTGWCTKGHSTGTLFLGLVRDFLWFFRLQSHRIILCTVFALRYMISSPPQTRFCSFYVRHVQKNLKCIWVPCK